MKEKYTSPSLALVQFVSAQRLAYSDIPFDNLKDPDFVGPGSFTQGDTEIDIPMS